MQEKLRMCNCGTRMIFASVVKKKKKNKAGKKINKSFPSDIPLAK